MTMATFRRRLCIACFVTVAIALVASPFGYWGMLNLLGPSTAYHDPYIEGATRLPGGKFHAFVGDRIFVRYTVIRHKINGSCLLNVSRYGEYVGGPWAGKRILFDRVELRFRGADDLFRPRWPLDGLVLDGALIPAGETQQEIELFVVARYYCNLLDELFPRYLQGGRPNETERVRLVIERRK